MPDMTASTAARLAPLASMAASKVAEPMTVSGVVAIRRPEREARRMAST